MNETVFWILSDKLIAVWQNGIDFCKSILSCDLMKPIYHFKSLFWWFLCILYIQVWHFLHAQFLWNKIYRSLLLNWTDENSCLEIIPITVLHMPEEQRKRDYSPLWPSTKLLYETAFAEGFCQNMPTLYKQNVSRPDCELEHCLRMSVFGDMSLRKIPGGRSSLRAEAAWGKKPGACTFMPPCEKHKSARRGILQYFTEDADDGTKSAWVLKRTIQRTR